MYAFEAEASEMAALECVEHDGHRGEDDGRRANAVAPSESRETLFGSETSTETPRGSATSLRSPSPLGLGGLGGGAGASHSSPRALSSFLGASPSSR